jgi:hypothetical protein
MLKLTVVLGSLLLRAGCGGLTHAQMGNFNAAATGFNQDMSNMQQRTAVRTDYFLFNDNYNSRPAESKPATVYYINSYDGMHWCTLTSSGVVRCIEPSL